ncbi:hypothetical protein QJS04_geneDACA012441 [Acorus gramineus]|uniref:Uncharacterized protein n=1 Tax=Acorus gramineus TaxID=55184 RepID=A0AAV9B820_ACOGR|nr:hypothetical protein QJS04_geneDACA012441 [Acorus gramineus]
MIPTERATTTMEVMPNSPPSEALIKAEAPKLVSLLEEMKNGLDVLTQELRFLREGSIDYNNASLREILDQTMIGNMNNSSGMSSADPFVSSYGLWEACDVKVFFRARGA